MVKLYIANNFKDVEKYLKSDFKKISKGILLLKFLDIDIENKLRESYDSKIIYKQFDIENIKAVRSLIMDKIKPNEIFISPPIFYHLRGYNITYKQTTDEKINRYYKTI